MFWEIIGHSAVHALEETAKMAPWLVLFYIVIELLENKVDLTGRNRLSGALGPVIGAATGLVPQCGFSVMAAKLFEKRYITVGTLLAIFLATSDEAFLVLLADGATDVKGLATILPMLAVKIIVGVAVGYAADGLMKAFGKGQIRPQPFPQKCSKNTTHEIFMTRYLEDVEGESVTCACGKPHETDRPFKTYVLRPLLHALQVILAVFAVNFVLTAIIEGTGGESVFASFMQNNLTLQPFLTSLIGLIPNCASSVVITQTYLEGGITFGACAAGLCANAGLGFVVLLKNWKEWKRNLALLGVSYVVAVGVGLLCNLILPATFPV